MVERPRHPDAEGSPDPPNQSRTDAPGSGSGGEVRDQRRHRDLLHMVPMAYVATDATGRVRDLNALAASLLGRPAESVRGRPLAELLSDASTLPALLARLGRAERVEPWDAELVSADGSVIPVRFAAAAETVEGADGVELHWFLSDLRAEAAGRHRDVALHREQAARAAMERVAHRARYISEASRRLMGVLEPAEVWRTAADIVADYAPGVLLLEAMDRAQVECRAVDGTAAFLQGAGSWVGARLNLASGDPVPFDLPGERIAAVLDSSEPEVVTAADSTTYVLVPLRAHVSPRGVMVVCLAPDAAVREELLVSSHVAERIALALETALLFQEVARARREAEAAGAAEAEFLAMVSHELRTPLTAIVSYAELLEQRSDELPDKMARYAHQIAAAAAHQRQLVEQILSYRRLKEFEEELEPEALDYRQSAQFALAMTRPYARGKPVDLELDLPEEPVRGTCDVAKLRQVLANLLTNAIRHTARGRVLLALEAEEPWVIFRVEDTGEGITPEALPRIFDRFYRGPGRSDEPRGSGLGLTITRDLVGRMHGEISVRSAVDVGTTFVVRLPRISPARATQPD